MSLRFENCKLTKKFPDFKYLCKLKNNETSILIMDKNSYALGMSIAHNMLQSGVKEVSFDDFVAGLKATLTRTKPAISYEEASDLLDKYFQQLQEKQAAEQAEIADVMKKEGEEFLAANAKKEGVIVLPCSIRSSKRVRDVCLNLPTR